MHFYLKILPLFSAAVFLIAAPIAAQEKKDSTKTVLIHPVEGKTVLNKPGFRLTFIARKHNYHNGPSASKDKDIRSPKSVHIHPDGSKYYVNSLEGCKTVAYDFATGNKLKVMEHSFDDSHAALWAPESGFFPMEYAYRHPNTFKGKPVESTFSHEGRYLWVPYYRRSIDLNAQDPSALAVIDTQKDTIIRLFETGPLPKMIATSADGGKIAVSHWGNNTVGVLDISSEQPSDWHYTDLYVVDEKLPLNFSRTVSVDRDRNSGYCLRGTVFTPDGRYILVGCMGNGGGIAVIDMETSEYLGRILGFMPNLRHILLKDDYLYASINNKGYVLRVTMENVYAAIASLRETLAASGKAGTARCNEVESCKVPAGARTIVISPDGKYVFAACNYASKLAVVDAENMKLLGTIDADSFPVGLDISSDGQYIFLTSQAHDGVGGGNALDIFEFETK